MSEQINKRQQEILQIIKEKESVDVNDLFKVFPVHPATVRKDLSVLEDTGLIVRKRGEAHIERSNVLTPFEIRGNMNREGKIAIARRAVQLIQEGDSVILDSGTTTLEIARLLVDRQDITVLTNSLTVATLLANTPVSVTIAGGQLFDKNMSTQGPEAERFFKQVQVNRLFVAASGIQPNTGLAALSLFEAAIKRSMIQAAREVIAVFDSSKMHAAGVNPFVDFKELDYFITDKSIQDETLRAAMERANLRLVIAEPV